MKLKIGARLTATFSAVLVLLLVICVIVNTQMSRMNANTESIVGERIAMLNVAREGQQGTYYTALYLYRALAERTPEAQKSDLELVESQATKNTEIYEKLKTHLQDDPNPQGRSVLENLLSIRKQYNVKLHPAHVDLAKNDTEGARQTLLDATDLQRQLLAAQEDLAQYENSQMTAAVEGSRDAYASAREVLWGCAIAALLVAVVLCWLVTRSITRPLAYLVEGANAVAAGDLTTHVDVKHKDEVGMVAQALNKAIEQVASIVVNVKSASESISSATQQLASGNADLSQRTEEQAASLEETASSMEELTATVRQNTENAKQASALANSASEVARRGGAVMEQVVETMRGIESSSSKVADITSVIESIAFQTNILALNAAVEAARAGEQGRGFAVVASEVRTLAQRSANAAKEIKTLIGDSASQVSAGSSRVREAGETIQEIVQSVMRVTDITNEIAASSVEQSAGIEQVGQAVSQMDQVTQQNAALVEESAAASHAMADQAHA